MLCDSEIPLPGAKNYVQRLSIYILSNHAHVCASLTVLNTQGMALGSLYTLLLIY